MKDSQPKADQKVQKQTEHKKSQSGGADEKVTEKETAQVQRKCR